MGLIHPEGIYDDPKGQVLRRELYQRLKFHFQYINELSLFPEVHHSTIYGTQIYSGTKSTPAFFSISNLFHPSTVYGCFVDRSSKPVTGIKVLDKKSNKMIWNTEPNSTRIVEFGESELRILANTFENSSEWEVTKLVSVHANQVLKIIDKIGSLKSTVKDFENKITKCWDQTNDNKKGIIRTSTQETSLGENELIYSGPHFFVATPFYKTPRVICELSSHYDVVDLNLINDNYTPLTNYVPGEDLKKFRTRISDATGENNWIDKYKLGFKEMLGPNSERTLQPAILPPSVSHLNTVVSIQFTEQNRMLELAFLSSSLPFDFFIKTLGRDHLIFDIIRNLPLGISNNIVDYGICRVLRMNCLSSSYQQIWKESFNQSWCQQLWSVQDMFQDATTFNQPIVNWDVSSVTDMGGMFDDASAFNQPIGNWDVSNVTLMGSMFGSNDFFNNTPTTSFNQPIGNWDVSKVIDMSGMFYCAKAFNQPLNNWDVGNVTGMSQMFSDAIVFNQPLDDWDVSKVTNMNGMFSCSVFNQDISNWDVSKVTNMKFMFEVASLFNQDLSSWSVDGVTSCGGFSDGAPLTEANTPNFTNCSLINLR